METAAEKNDGPRNPTSSSSALATLGIVIAIGLLPIIVYSARMRGSMSPWGVLGVGLLLAGASTLGGGLLGFLFGIPRAATTNTNNSASYRANTNLEDISDWLTKILVGVGLTQVGTFPGWLKTVAAFFSPGLGGTTAAPTFAIAILLHFMVSGFLFAYLWTRLFLAGALAAADRNALLVIESKLKESQTATQTLAKEVDQIKKQSEDDARALVLTEKQLALPAGNPDVDQAELTSAIQAASTGARVQIFNRAHTIRQTTWRDPQTKAAMERTIPIFKALIAADAEGKYHGNHGQLGFALKDQRNPDWQAALIELNRAIEIRGSWAEKGGTYYELNRALCNIALDPDFKIDQPSKSGNREAILLDLRAASVELPSVVSRIPEIQRWLAANHLTLEDLESETPRRRF